MIHTFLRQIAADLVQSSKPSSWIGDISRGRPIENRERINILLHKIHIHVKLEKFQRGRSPSLHLAKEGDFAQNAFILLWNIQILAEFY